MDLPTPSDLPRDAITTIIRRFQHDAAYRLFLSQAAVQGGFRKESPEERNIFATKGNPREATTRNDDEALFSPKQTSSPVEGSIRSTHKMLAGMAVGLMIIACYIHHLETHMVPWEARSTQQYPLADPNVMLMTNAAATIAAVAASAVQQMAQRNGLLSGGAGTTTSMPPALVAAVRSAGNQPVPSHPQSNTSISPHVPAFFGAEGGGQHSIQFQNPTSMGSMPSQLQQALNQGEAASALHTSAAAAAQAAAPMSSGAISNALLPSMQK
jgi:hypothetical protein